MARCERPCRSALVEVLGAGQAQISRLFAGKAYLSATQHAAVERFTGGAISAAMLEGTKPPPPSAEAPRRAQLEVPVVPAAPTPTAARPQTAEKAERTVDEFAAKAMPAALRVVVQQLVQAKSESDRRRCAETRGEPDGIGAAETSSARARHSSACCTCSAT